MNAIFTIVAKNYIGLAQVLEKSVQKYSNIDFFIFVADDFSPSELSNFQLPPNVIIAKKALNFDNECWNEMAFKYNLVEFCTSIKPACFSYLFKEKKYKKVIFTDPDVFFFNKPEILFTEMGEHSIMLTPHILEMQTEFQGDYPDYLFLVNGTFNLGFLGLSNTNNSHLFLDWWHNRLKKYCFFDFEKGMATDQKWINMLPSFFGQNDLLISFHKGYNVAPWNYHERKMTCENDELLVTSRLNTSTCDPLVFVHFSGYNYNGFIQNNINHKNENASNFQDYDVVFNKYAEALISSDFNKYHTLKYSYNYFENGNNIISINRRIFRILSMEGKRYPNPFEIGNGSFYTLLKQKKLLDLSVVTADKLTNKNIQGFDKKIKWVNAFFILIKNIIGIKKYSIMIRFFKRYFNEENQTFLADNQTNRKFQ